jgi:ATP-dependent DNA helicase UvrD/PcrA
MVLRKGTPQQREIWKVLAKEQCHVMVEALAGTGKTTTIAAGAGKLPKGQTVAFVVFGRANAAEFRQKLPPHVQSSTLNSLGNRACYRAYDKSQVDRDKTAMFLPPMMDRQTKRAVMRLVSLCKGNLLDGRNQDELDALCANHNIELNGERAMIFGMIPNILEQSRQMTAVIDYDDQIWLPIVNNLPMYKFDVLMVDEFQDMNLAQQELCLKAGHRLVMVGDRHQAIMGFRGADVISMQRMHDRLAASKRGIKVLPLTVTFRVPIAGVILARHIVPGLEAWDDAIVGKILRGEEAKKRPFEIGDMVLCRVNAPLISMAYGFIKEGKRVTVQGRDIGEGLKNKVLKLAAPRDSVIDLTARVEEERARETARIQADESHILSNESKLLNLNDRCDCIIALCEGMDLVQDVIARIEALFDNMNNETKQDVVLLSSVHRAKGLESKVVHIINQELLPHPMARQPWELDQERNLLYVAYTRFKEVMVLR